MVRILLVVIMKEKNKKEIEAVEADIRGSE